MKKLIIIALVMSIITGFSVYYYAQNLKKELSVKTVPVVVAAKAIPKNMAIKDDMVIIKQLPVEAVNELAIKTIDEIKNRITKQDIELNEQILNTKLSKAQGKNDELSIVIKEGYRAISIRTDEISGVAGYINKGDFVDLVGVMIDPKSISGVSSKMVVENAEVLEIGMKPLPGNEKTEALLYTSVTLLIKNEDLLKVNYAVLEGKFNLVLRSVLDKTIVSPMPFMPN